MKHPSVPRLKAPIVLIHGFFGFDHVQVGGRKFSYFPGIVEALGVNGTRVLSARVNPTAGIVHRAQELRAFLDRELPGEAVHILAHSMGGLDSRYMITHLGMASRVLSLTTLGTPHQGTPLADWATRLVVPLVRPILDLLRIPMEALPDLTSEACRRFNEATPNAPGVRYFSVAGHLRPTWHKWHLHIPERYVYHREGPNDCLVSVASATFGEDCQVWSADHMDLVNWSDPVLPVPRREGHDFAPSYVRLVQRLADSGF